MYRQISGVRPGPPPVCRPLSNFACMLMSQICFLVLSVRKMGRKMWRPWRSKFPFSHWKGISLTQQLVAAAQAVRGLSLIRCIYNDYLDMQFLKGQFTSLNRHLYMLPDSRTKRSICSSLSVLFFSVTLWRLSKCCRPAEPVTITTKSFAAFCKHSNQVTELPQPSSTCYIAYRGDYPRLLDLRCSKFTS